MRIACGTAAIYFLKHYDLTARAFFILFSRIAGSVNPVLIHSALTSRIISVPDCNLQSCEYSHEIKYNNGISSRA